MIKASKAIYDVVRPAVEALGYELVGIEHITGGRQPLLRIYIDLPGGITADDCAQTSRQVNAALMVEPTLSKRDYLLEVSSPGIDRLLFEVEDFERFTGRRVRVKLAAPIDNRRQFSGELQGVVDGHIKLQTDEATIELPLSQIEKARLQEEL